MGGVRIIAKDGQTLLDLGLRYGGSVEWAFALALTNGMSLTDVPEDGMELDWPGFGAEETGGIVAHYRARGTEPATAPDAMALEACPYGGVGLMGVEVDFIVS